MDTKKRRIKFVPKPLIECTMPVPKHPVNLGGKVVVLPTYDTAAMEPDDTRTHQKRPR